MTDKRQCVSCGAPIPHGALRCEYCGMEYEPDYWAGTLRYVPIRMRSRHLCAEAAVDNSLLHVAGSEAVANHVKSDLVHKLAEGLSEMMTIRMRHDPRLDITIVRGELWVEEPDSRAMFTG